MTAPTLTPTSEEEASAPRRRRPWLAGAAGGLAAAARRISTGARRIVAAGPSRRPWVVGPVAALWAGIIGLAVAVLPLLVVWMATPESGLTWRESIRVAGLMWGVAHGAPIAVSATTYSLVPWGLAIVPILLLAYAGGWAVRRSTPDSVRGLLALIGSAVITYAAGAGCVAAASARPTSQVGVLPAVVYAAAMALLALGFGACRAWGLDRRLLPSWLLIPLRSGLIGVFTILGLGAVAGTAALALHVDDAVTMSQSLHAGVWGGLALLLLGIAYVPVIVVWSSAYVLGAGVIIGPSIAVSPFVPVTAPTQLPPFPMLAAVPQSASPLAWALPLAGVVAGVLVGLSVARLARHEPRLLRLAMAIGAAGVTGIAIAGLAFLASGSLGDLRLANLGPPALTVGVLAFVLITLGAVPSAVVAASPGKRRLSVTPSVATDASPPDVSPDG